MNCLKLFCSSIINCWYKSTEKCFKKNYFEKNVQDNNNLYLCNYPYCFKLTQWHDQNTNKFIKFRDKIYCSEQCLKLHQNINYGTINDDYNCNYNYANL